MLDKELQHKIAPIVMALGYELVGVERLSQRGHNTLLRVYIDHLDGITLDDCQQVSHQVSNLLEGEDPIQGHYSLEISSPGLDRPLFTLEHFKRFVGHKIKVHLSYALEGRSNFTGILQDVQDGNVIILVDKIEYSLSFEDIDKTHIVSD